MNKFYNETLSELETTITEIETDCSVQRIEAVIYHILECLSELKGYVLKRGFKNIEEEICFFKYQKPAIVAKLIYYNAIYKIETKKPYGVKPIRKYLNKELKKLKRFFDNNIDFYKYYRSNNSFLDESFFVRGKHDIKLWLDTFYFEADHRFSTSHDYKVAKIIANDLIQVYLEDRLNNINVKRGSDNSLKWTASKTALTELIYALYSHGVFNNGNTDIKLIAKTFEEAFNIELGDFYHTFMELKARKINRTKFLDSLCEALIKKMDEKDEK
ncbi:RteC domain-containing protein [Empedobacter brevis]|uniref:Tetracycline regulation of excision, RteC n=2 Tax=Weeksellaceae TaxID=2762318 RepID=A0A3G8WUI4_9FLAO|nr:MULTISPECIES: RteC domain-containing protein [Flavobacteriales]AZI19396.1 tetracycline regulation of excision, RteC [Chryseobacterium taklimakanense]MBL7869148.1 RteC domain-containing protein [Flavobacterium lindanitolerans]MDM1072606.1 RteC domain-containing protein [Empedobacter brevis]UTG61710.1 RteC domain-containing protein [Elizabethkingia anophelis]UXM67962.1 RteC domain-containing protein [Elizabethkingia anophelis]